MKELVYIKTARQTPFITKDGFQRVILKLRSNYAAVELWARITLKGVTPYTVYVGKIPFGKSIKIRQHQKKSNADF